MEDDTERLPDGDAIDLLARIRSEGSRVPVLMLTAHGTLQQQLEGFEHGADDYVVKPFELTELVLRVRALARRDYAPRPSVVRVAVWKST